MHPGREDPAEGPARRGPAYAEVGDRGARVAAWTRCPPGRATPVDRKGMLGR